MKRVSSVMSLWTITRIIWGIATLLVFKYDIELLQDSDTPVWSFVVLLLLFFVCEILPIIALLDYSYLSMIGIELVEIRSTESHAHAGVSPILDTSMNTTTTNNNGLNTSGLDGDSILLGLGGGDDTTTSSAQAEVRNTMGPLLAAVLPLEEGTPTRRRAIRWHDESSSSAEARGGGGGGAITDPLLDGADPQQQPQRQQDDSLPQQYHDPNTSVISA